MLEKPFRFDPLPRADARLKADVAALVLRLALAVIFLYHGSAKVFAPEANWGSAWAERAWGGEAGEVPASLHVPAVQLAVAWGELLGGAALLLGCLARLAALGLILIQLGAVYLVTLGRGFSVREGGYEYNLALIAMCLAVLVLGGGACAVDRLFAARPQAPAEPPRA
jgi:putative oxidoreductase